MLLLVQLVLLNVTVVPSSPQMALIAPNLVLLRLKFLLPFSWHGRPQGVPSYSLLLLFILLTQVCLIFQAPPESCDRLHPELRLPPVVVQVEAVPDFVDGGDDVGARTDRLQRGQRLKHQDSAGITLSVTAFKDLSLFPWKRKSICGIELLP